MNEGAWLGPDPGTGCVRPRLLFARSAGYSRLTRRGPERPLRLMAMGEDKANMIR